MTAPDPRTEYYTAAQSWAEDHRAGARRALRLAWTLAAIATGVAGLEAMALAALVPLKSVVPYTLLVDRNTGFVETLKGGQVPAVAPRSALVQAMLAQYVSTREGFDITTLAADYRKVALWSAGDARRDYLAMMPAGQPESPLTVYPRTAIVDVAVESISWIGPQVALVRFVTKRRDAAAAQAPRSFWVATVAWRMTEAPMSIADRLVNPLGFEVVAYHRTAEIPPPALPLAASAEGDAGSPPVAGSGMGPVVTAPSVLPPIPRARQPS